MGEKTFYVTTPIYYANAKPHIGHAYTTIVADVLTRFHRQRGVDSFFLTGTDEHGVNIERAAEARDIAVRDHVDQVVDQFKAAFAKLEVNYDRWIRTTDPRHEAAVQTLWRALEARGFIYKGSYEGWFCGYCNEFKDPSELVEEASAGGGFPGPYAGELLCPIHELPVDHISEESYFFKLSEMQRPLLEHYEKHPEFVKPDVRRNEVVSFCAGGLKDLSVSRVSVKWGIPVPGDPNHTIYVWLDALSNYITALGWGTAEHQDFDRYWPALHLVGKDILRQHAVYWPAFLLAAGVELPRQVYAHGMLLRGGQKMGKTLGNAIQLEVLHRHFTPDMIRYFLLREVAFGQDGEVTYEALVDRVNSDLADGLGNLASRTLTMVRNYFDGRPPRPSLDENFGKLKTYPYEYVATEGADPHQADYERDFTPEVKFRLSAVKLRFEREFEALEFSHALESVWLGIARVDKFITRQEPWKVSKDQSRRGQLETIIAFAYEGLRQLVLLVAPVIPVTSRQIWSQMGLAGDPLQINPYEAKWGESVEVSKIDRITPAFPKLDKEKIMTEINNEASQSSASATSEPAGAQAEQPKREERASEAAAAQAESNVITIDDFVKIELRAATVLEAERVPKADKLLRLLVDLGEEKPRQILAGIAQHYAPEEVVGRKIIVVSNLAPRKLRGLESNGMLLAASIGEDGRPVLATFTEDVPNGARLK
jgi:methionyl-tRNA synthetase